MTTPALVWFRQDLRLTDNPALFNACLNNRPIIPIYIYDIENPRPIRGAAKWWLERSLEHLNNELHHGLQVFTGKPEEILLELAQKHNIQDIFWNRVYEPYAIKRDTQIKAHLNNQGHHVHSYNGNFLFDSYLIKNKSGQPFKVFSAFWRHAMRECQVRDDLPAPTITLWDQTQHEHTAQYNPRWSQEWKNLWSPGEKGARECFEHFMENILTDYKDFRDFPGKPSTSQLSPYLRFGEISPVYIWHTLHRQLHLSANHQTSAPTDKFLSELGWREFNTYLITHNPNMINLEWNPKFRDFPWKSDPKALEKWKKGQTGYPIVDAGMRELDQTGFMHNRVRMIVASFLIKDLLIDWREGEDHFDYFLIDSQLANNVANWQWVAGCGADAAPYFRIFNPELQSEKFDSEGLYLRKWIPELAKLPNKYIHNPGKAPDHILAKAGVKIGQTYPSQMVNHKFARERALEVFKELKD